VQSERVGLVHVGFFDMLPIALRGTLPLVLIAGLFACGERMVSVVGDGEAFSPNGNVAPALKPVQPLLVIKVGEQRDLLPFLRLTETGAVPFIPLTWEVSNPELLSIDSGTGRAKGLGAGIVVVQVKAAGNGANLGQVRTVGGTADAAQMIIEIVGEGSAVVKDVQVLPGSSQLVVGDSVTLRAQVFLPDGQINGNVVWASSDNTIATVNPTTGSVTALKPGRVTIVAGYALAPAFKGLADIIIYATKAELPASPPALSPSVLPTQSPAL